MLGLRIRITTTVGVITMDAGGAIAAAGGGSTVVAGILDRIMLFKLCYQPLGWG